MPTITKFSSMSTRMIRSRMSKILDIFNRVTSGNLGSSWTAIRGTWYTNGSLAQSDDSPSNYSIAAVKLSSTDMKVSASISSGTGVVFWLTDSGSWWASTSSNSSSSYSYSCNPWQAFCFTNAFVNCKNGLSSSATGCYSTSYIGSCSALISSLSGACTTGIASSGCGGGSISTKYDTCTGYNYFYYLTLKNSVAGTMSTVVSDVALGSQPAAIKVTTQGNTITAQAYSDTALTSTLGSQISVTPSSPNKGTSAGIIKEPTSYNQQSAVYNFSAEG